MIYVYAVAKLLKGIFLKEQDGILRSKMES